MKSSLLTILKILASFVNATDKIKRIHYDSVDYFNDNLKVDDAFPVLFVTLIKTKSKENVIEYTVRLKIADLLQNDRSNQKFLVSELNLTMNDLFLWLKSNDTDYDILNDEFNYDTKINDSIGTVTVTGDIIIQINNYSDCLIPFLDPVDIFNIPCTNVNPKKYLTCNDLINCPIINEITNDIQVINNDIEVINNTLLELQEQINNLEPGGELNCDIISQCEVITNIEENIDLINETLIDLQQQINNIEPGSGEFSCLDLEQCLIIQSIQETLIDLQQQINNIDGGEFSCLDLMTCQTIIDIQSELYNNGESIYDLIQNNVLINNNISTLNNNIITLGESIDDLQQQINNIDSFNCGELDTCQTIITIQNDIEILYQESGENQNDISILFNTIDNIENNIINLQQQINNLQPSGEFDCGELDSCEQIITINETLIDLQQQINNLTPGGEFECSYIDNCQTIIDILLELINIQNQIDNIDQFNCGELDNCQTIINIQNDIINIQNQINNIPIFDCGELNNCQTIIDINNNLDSLGESITLLEETVINIQQQIDNIDQFNCNDLDNCQTIIDIENDIYNNYEYLSGEINFIESDITTINNDIIIINNDIINIQNQLNNIDLCGELDSCETIIDIQLELNNLQNQINNIDQFNCGELDTCQTIIDIQLELNNLQNQIDNLPTTGIDCDELNECQSIIDINNELDYLSGELDSITSGLGSCEIVQQGTIGITIEGFNEEIIPNTLFGYITVPFDCTISGYNIIADIVGDIEIDIWVKNNDIPIITDSITGTNPAILNAQQINNDSTLTGWSKDLLQGDVIRFEVVSVTDITQVTLALKVDKEEINICGQFNDLPTIDCDDLNECQTIIDINNELDYLSGESIFNSGEISFISGELLTINNTLINLQEQINNIEPGGGEFECSMIEECQTVIDLIQDVTDNQTDIDALAIGSIVINIDGNGNVIDTAKQYPYLSIPFPFTIDSYTIISDITGSIEVEVWAKSAGIPTISDKISASVPIILSAQQYNSSSSLTGWTTTFAAGSVFYFKINSASALKLATITLKINKL